MTTTNQKLDLILNRLDSLNSKISVMNICIEQLEAKFNLRIETIELSLKIKINFNEMEDNQERLEKLEDHKFDQQSKGLVKESYDKLLNVLMHGLEESVENP